MARTIGAMSASYEEDRKRGEKTERLLLTARQGETVELEPEEEARLDELGVLVAKGSTLQEHLDAPMLAYRAERGDTGAAAELAAARSGGIVNLSEESAEGDDVLRLAAYIRDTSPTVDETVALAEDDPAKAEKVLEAENLVTGQEPRKGVEDGLSKIIADAAAEE